jgi:hypothetical protein
MVERKRMILFNFMILCTAPRMYTYLKPLLDSSSTRERRFLFSISYTPVLHPINEIVMSVFVILAPAIIRSFDLMITTPFRAYITLDGKHFDDAQSLHLFLPP